MKISPAAEYAIRGIMVLAERYGKGPVTLEIICSERDLPKQYMVKIFASLTKADLVNPIRGKKGGFLLARAPEKINLLEVVEAVEGPIAVNLCQHMPAKCPNVECTIRPIWSEIQAFIRNRLSSVSLAGALKATKAATPTPV